MDTRLDVRVRCATRKEVVTAANLYSKTIMNCGLIVKENLYMI